MGGLAGYIGCHWRCLALWVSGVWESRQHFISCCNRCLQHPSPVCCWTSVCLPTPVCRWKQDEGSSLWSPLPCREEGVGPRGVLTSARMFVPLHISLACTAPFQSTPVCIPLARVTAPCSPSSPPLWQTCGVLFIRCRLRPLNYSDLFPESEKTCSRGRSAARCMPSFPHLWVSAVALICTDAVCEAAGCMVVPAFVGRDQILGVTSVLTAGLWSCFANFTS